MKRNLNIILTSKWRGPKKSRQPENEDDLKNKDDHKNEDNLKNEDSLINEEDLKNKDNLQHEDNLKIKDNLNKEDDLKKWWGPQKWRRHQKWRYPKNQDNLKNWPSPWSSLSPSPPRKDYLIFLWCLILPAPPHLTLNQKCYQGFKPKMEFHMINMICAALPMCAQTEKTTFSSKDD